MTDTRRDGTPIVNESVLLERGVMNLDLSTEALDGYFVKHIKAHPLYPIWIPIYSFAQVIAAELLGCDPREVTAEQIEVVECALQHRNWGGPNE